MPTTKTPSQLALLHVLDVVLVLGNQSGLRLALQAAGYIKIQSVLSMSEQNMSALTYKTKDSTNKVLTHHLALNDISTLEALKGFAVYKEAHIKRLLTPDDWLDVTEDEFDAYQGSSHLIFFNPNKPAANPPPGALAAVVQTQIGNVAPDVLAFRRGIRRDQSLFPHLKDEKEWDDWQRRTRTQATAQGLANVLDPTYVPVLHQDIELFHEQNKYMMAVFTTCIQTDFGQGLIRKFEDTHDAQALFMELEHRAKSSTTAILTATQLLSYVTTARLGSDTWNGTTTSFVLHWEEQVRLYDRYSDVQSRFGSVMKTTLLQNAVNGITDLRQVKLNADQMLQATGHPTSYQHYRDLLLNACARYDVELQTRGRRSHRPISNHSNTRTVYVTDVDYDDSYPPTFGFDTPLDVVTAYRTRMTGAQWHKLDPESQRIWDSLSDAAKEVILAGNAPSNRPNRGDRQGSRNPRRPPPQTP